VRSTLKRYGRRFLIVSAVVAALLFGLLLAIGLPAYLAVPIAVLGAVPVTVAIGVWVVWVDAEVAPSDRQLERANLQAAERRGRQYLDDVRRGRD